MAWLGIHLGEAPEAAKCGESDTYSQKQQAQYPGVANLRMVWPENHEGAVR